MVAWEPRETPIGGLSSLCASTENATWNNGDEIANAYGATSAVTYSNVQGGHAGMGNIDGKLADPISADVVGGRYFQVAEDAARMLE
jgi:hypothetical protein